MMDHLAFLIYLQLLPENLREDDKIRFVLTNISLGTYKEIAFKVNSCLLCALKNSKTNIKDV